MQAMPPADDANDFPDEATFFAADPDQIPGFEVPRDFVARMTSAVGNDRQVRDHAVTRLVNTHGEVPAISATFVQRTLDALRAEDNDEQGTAHDLEKPLPQEWLDAHAIPAPSPDFVGRTLAGVLADRSAADASLSDLLHQADAPAASTTFVDRTLAAVMADRATESARPLDRRPSAARTSAARTRAARTRAARTEASGGKLFRVASWVAPIAALFVLSFLLFQRLSSDADTPFEPTIAPLQARSAVLNAPRVASSYGASVYGTLFGRNMASNASNIPAAEDGLILTSHGLKAPPAAKVTQGR